MANHELPRNFDGVQNVQLRNALENNREDIERFPFYGFADVAKLQLSSGMPKGNNFKGYRNFSLSGLRAETFVKHLVNTNIIPRVVNYNERSHRIFLDQEGVYATVAIAWAAADKSSQQNKITKLLIEDLIKDLGTDPLARDIVPPALPRATTGRQRYVSNLDRITVIKGYQPGSGSNEYTFISSWRNE